MIKWLLIAVLVIPMAVSYLGYWLFDRPVFRRDNAKLMIRQGRLGKWRKLHDL